jgi:hypothetical protein
MALSSSLAPSGEKNMAFHRALWVCSGQSEPMIVFYYTLANLALYSYTFDRSECANLHATLLAQSRGWRAKFNPAVRLTPPA